LAVDFALHARDPESSGLALTSVLRRKGRVLDTIAGGVRALRARLGPEEQKLLDELNAARSRYAALVLRGPGATPRDAYQDDLRALSGQIEEREDAISRHSAPFRARQRPVTIDAVQAALPEGTALVEWIAYQPFNHRPRTWDERWGPRRYAACVLPK